MAFIRLRPFQGWDFTSKIDTRRSTKYGKRNVTGVAAVAETGLAAWFRTSGYLAAPPLEAKRLTSKQRARVGQVIGVLSGGPSAACELPRALGRHRETL
eukprot:2266368-Pleurochrysis_carterae.AAC.1